MVSLFNEKGVADAAAAGLLKPPRLLPPPDRVLKGFAFALLFAPGCSNLQLARDTKD